MEARTPLGEPLDSPALQADTPAHSWATLGEEAASQGYKTGHMRWVLAIGFALAGIGLGLTALLA